MEARENNSLPDQMKDIWSEYMQHTSCTDSLVDSKNKRLVTRHVATQLVRIYKGSWSKKLMRSIKNPTWKDLHIHH